METKNNKPLGNGHNPTGLVMQASLELLPLIMNNIPQAVFWKDRDLVYLGCNQAFADDAGFSSPKDVVGKTDFDMPWKAQAELYRADDSLVMEKGEPKINYEEPQTTPSGSTIWLSTSKIPVRENGKIVAVLGMYEDVTARKQVETDLLLRDRALASSLNAVIILNLQDNKPIYVNDAILKMTGYTREEVMQVGLSEITGNPAAPKEIRAAIQTQGFFVGEELIKRKDGSVFPANFFSSLITNDKGQPIAVQSTFFDITERKQAEEARRASEEQFRSLYNNATIGLYRTTPDGRILMINPTGLQLLGFDTFEELARRNLEEAGFEQEDARRKFREELENKGVIDQESIWTKKDGSPIFVRESATVFRDENGKVLYYDGSFEDITARKQAEEAVRESEERFRRFTEATVEGLVFHEKGKIMDANPAALAMFGLSDNSEFVGRNLLEFIVPESHKMVLQQMQLETVLPYEIQCIRADGATFPVETATRTYKVGDRVIRASSIRDITERKGAETELQKEKIFSDAVINGLPGIFFLFDPQGNMVRWNKEYERALGYTTEEITTRNAIDPIADEDKEKTAAAIQRAFIEGQSTVEANIVTKDGKHVPYYFVGQRIQLDDQLYLAGTGIDITERRQAEAEVQKNQQLLQSFLNNFPDGAWVKDLEGHFLIANRYLAENIYGTTIDQVIGKTVYETFPKNVADFVWGSEKRLLETGETIAVEEDIPQADGQVYNKITTKFPLYDVDGNINGLGGVLIDITERKRLEAQANEAFEHRGYQVQVSTEISQEVSAAPELNELFDRVVTLTKERLGYYHTQLLRYDATQDAVVLVNGYGETGQKMLAGGHKMPLGSGLIGTTAATGKTVMRSTLAEDPDWQPNPLLPETKGEIAVPIKFGEQILGVLDVQSDQAGSLAEDDRLLLEGLCGQIAVAIEQTRLRQEMAERLEEVNRLYRSMSHEGWKTYRETANLPTGFVFDQTGTKPVEDVALADGSFTSVPMKVLGGETVGNLSVTNDPRRPMSQEDIDFLQQVSDQVALALEGARLSAQTQSALAQSEKLFESSRILTQSADLQEMTATTVSMLDIPAINRAILTTFNYDAQDNIESLDIVANWWNGTGHEITAVGTHYPYDVIRAMSFFISPTPVFFGDTHTDERVDATTMKLVERLNLRAVAVLPLYTGARQIGALILEAEVPHNFTQEETRLFTALAPQISTMLENRRQFERAQQQAERESTLNIISQKIQSATTVEAVLQIAARELGHALGAPMTIAQLSMKDKK